MLLDRYKVIGHLGDGGMGSVYLVEHTTILKKFAAKVLSPALSTRQDFIDRFLREARAASVISHPNVVEITDFGKTPGGEPFFIMEYLQGEDLSETIADEGPMRWSRVSAMILQICGALEAAHEQGIVHRDMKPGNCLRVKSGNNKDFIKVLDFGIAKVQSLEAEERSLTQTGTVIGTPEYMSPEQGWGHPVDHRSDIYAVGVILYELLTGHVPFTGETMMEVLNRHIYEVPNVDHPHISQEVGAIILKAMQKDRELRFQSMSEMIAAIEGVGTGAEPVKVVDEEIKAPWGPVTARYTTAVTQITISSERDVTAEGVPLPSEEPAPKRSGAVIGLVLAGLVGVGVIGLVLVGGDDPPPKTDPTPVAAPAEDDDGDEAGEPEPEPEPPPVVIEPGAKTVQVMISTPGVDAQILDARDEAIYGKTNAPEGVPIRQGEEVVKLILRADGYEDLEIPVVPDVDGKVFEKTLVKSKSAKKKVVTKKKKPESGETGGDKPKPDPKEDSGGANLGEIKNPFAK
ncbi:MAG: serine/threonine protein kinase [Myxococcales bacterium]|nr:serine/threonine protein kinase [Myxococcales bacterium]